MKIGKVILPLLSVGYLLTYSNIILKAGAFILELTKAKLSPDIGNMVFYSLRQTGVQVYKLKLTTFVHLKDLD